MFFGRAAGFWILVTFCFGAQAAFAHPGHRSIAEVEFDPDRSALEVALRVPSYLFERALKRRVSAGIDLDQPEVDVQIAQYLRDTFRVRLQPGPTDLQLAWVGKEVGVKQTWLYFEYSLPDSVVRPGDRALDLAFTTLFEFELDQTNLISFRVGRNSELYQFTIRRPAHRIPLVIPRSKREPVDFTTRADEFRVAQRLLKPYGPHFRRHRDSLAYLRWVVIMVRVELANRRGSVSIARELLGALRETKRTEDSELSRELLKIYARLAFDWGYPREATQALGAISKSSEPCGVSTLRLRPEKYREDWNTGHARSLDQALAQSVESLRTWVAQKSEATKPSTRELPKTTRDS